MKTIVACCTLLFTLCAWPDDQAAVTFSGKGKGGIEVRDASGKVEVVNPSTLRLNQIPADAAAREKVYREQVEAEATALAERRAEENATAETAAKEAVDAKAAEQAAQVSAAEEAAAERKKHYPTKVRGKTVRGTLYIENPPEEAPVKTEPPLFISGKKKAAPAAEPTAADTVKHAPPPASTTNSAPENF